LSVIFNGPLADRFGGRRAILFAALGTAAVNAGVRLQFLNGWTAKILVGMCLLYAVNQYFQSFGALSVVKVNTPWFHVRERGTFGGIFGCMIQSGYMLALGVGGLIVDRLDVSWVFFIPAVVMSFVWFFNYVVVRESPGHAGH